MINNNIEEDKAESFTFSELSGEEKTKRLGLARFLETAGIIGITSSLLCLSVSSTKVKIKADPVSCCLSVVISFIVAIVLLSITLDVSKISEVGKDVVISVIIGVRWRLVVTESNYYH